MKQIVYCFKCQKHVAVTKVFYEDRFADNELITEGRSRIGDLEVKCGHSWKERIGENK